MVFLTTEYANAFPPLSFLHILRNFNPGLSLLLKSVGPEGLLVPFVGEVEIFGIFWGFLGAWHVARVMSGHGSGLRCRG